MRELHTDFDLVVVTSRYAINRVHVDCLFKTFISSISTHHIVAFFPRQHEIAAATVEWLNSHFLGIFKDVMFGNHWAKDAPNPDIETASKRYSFGGKQCHCDECRFSLSTAFLLSIAV